MGGNPVENKVEAARPADVLAAAAGIPTPPNAGGLWAKFWRHRKLALLLGGAGLALGGGGYGYKYFTAIPGRANAQPDTAAVASASMPEAPKPIAPSVRDEAPIDLPAVKPVKTELPDVPDVNLPAVKPPADTDKRVKPTIFGSDKTDTEPAVIAPILPPNPDDKTKKPVKVDDPPDLPPIDLRIPAASDRKAPTDQKKPEVSDRFRSAGPVTRENDQPQDRTKGQTGPGPLPADMTEKDKPTGKDGRVIRTGAADPMPPAPPADMNPVVVTPPAPLPTGPAKMGEAPAVPDVPKLVDPVIPPGPMPMKTGDPVVSPPADTPIVNAPSVVAPKEKPEAKTPEVPTIKVDVKLPDAPPLPGDLPSAKLPSPPIDTNPLPPIGPSPGAAGPAKKTDYEEDWHTWRSGDTMALVSQEFFHDARYAAALEAYNKDRRSPGNNMIRVPPTWVLEEQFGHLIKADKEKADKTDRPERPETKPAGGINFEPAAPIASGRRPPPPPATPVSRTDEYRVTAEESVRDVAHKALGDANAWRKLTELNPSIDPTLPIPAGTVLKLPK
jgi:hypothetical protein